MRPPMPLNTLDASTAAKSHPPNGGLLLDFDLGAGFFELLLDRRGFVLAHAFLYGLRRAIDEVLGFLQSEAGYFADSLDDVDLVAAHVGENHGELRLLFHRSRSSRRATAASGRN